MVRLPGSVLVEQRCGNRTGTHIAPCRAPGNHEIQLISCWRNSCVCYSGPARAVPEVDNEFDAADKCQLVAAMTYAGIPPEQHREMQLEFLGILCGLFGRILPGAADCQCDVGFGIFIACMFEEPLCQGDFCTQPVVTAGFNYLTQ